jgi:hypothetical protein
MADNKEKMNKMIDMISKKTGTDSGKMRDAINSGSIDNVLNNLGPAEAQKLKQVLSDKAQTERLLQTEQAQQLLKKLLGDK